MGKHKSIAFFRSLDWNKTDKELAEQHHLSTFTISKYRKELKKSKATDSKVLGFFRQNVCKDVVQTRMELATELDVSIRTINHYCTIFGVKPKDNKSQLEILADMPVDWSLPDHIIAEMTGVDASYVRATREVELSNKNLGNYGSSMDLAIGITKQGEALRQYRERAATQALPIG